MEFLYCIMDFFNNLKLKQVIPAFDDLLKRNKFKKIGQYYIRIMNKEVYQEIWFQAHSSGNEFTVNISIIPLCSKIINVKNFTLLRMGSLFYDGYDKWWGYDDDSVSEAFDVFEKQLIPLLDKLSTYEEIYNFIEPIMNVKVTEQNFIKPEFQICSSISKFLLALKFGNYDYCLSSIEKDLEDLESSTARRIESLRESLNSTSSPEYKKEFSEAIVREEEFYKEKKKKIEETKKKMKNKEYESFLKEAEDYEKQNLKELSKYIV